MINYKEYKNHEKNIVGKKKKYDETIYTFDIETTSYLILYGKQIPACDYLKLDEEEQHEAKKCSTMYIWMFGINESVYFGRTWEEFKEFLNMVFDFESTINSYIWVHNLAFEFQYLKSIYNFQDVIARKSHKVMSATIENTSITFRCSFFLSNCALRELPKLYGLNVEKMIGDLDYKLIRNRETILDEKELKYCENDCLVLYQYIKKELETYETINKLPKTSTGKVRKELKSLTIPNYEYRRRVRKAINVDPHVYNLLQKCFMGGYTHANFIYTDEIIRDVDSYDETSAYPYVLVTHKFPSTEFKKIRIKRREQMLDNLAYIVTVKFTNLKSKYFNTYISQSKCNYIRGGKYDNGRIIEADEIEITLTDVDFKLILDWYNCKYEIIESYYSIYNYLPKLFINFVLDKYVIKTALKGVKGKELEYQKEKNKYNALYGMSVTNTIRDEVIYDNDTKLWRERELTNEEIEDKLLKEKNTSFLSFAYGVWVTAHARNNLLRRVMELDENVIYCDTDSIKLTKGYNKVVIDEYNKSVEKKIEFVSQILHINKDRFAPLDKNGNSHMLGIFEVETEDGKEHTYEKFITQGAKKYAYQNDKKIHITVAGVPKVGAKALKKLEEFKDDFVFRHEDTGKQLLFYTEEQEDFNLTDYQGNTCLVQDKSGCCIVPTTYILKKSIEYCKILTEESSNRSIYKERI